jgi:peroxiredoxin
MRSDIMPGAIFPDYELSDHSGKHRKLSALQGPHPMVLVLSRGGFCPKDRRQAEGLVQLHRELEVAYCRLVTISTDNISQTNEYRSGVGAHWPFLSDAGRIVQKDLDIAEYTDPVNNPMIPHLIVLVQREMENWRSPLASIPPCRCRTMGPGWQGWQGHPRVDATIPHSGKHGAGGQLATKRIISAPSCVLINNVAGQ